MPKLKLTFSGMICWFWVSYSRLRLEIPIYEKPSIDLIWILHRFDVPFSFYWKLNWLLEGKTSIWEKWQKNSISKLNLFYWSIVKILLTQYLITSCPEARDGHRYPCPGGSNGKGSLCLSTSYLPEAFHYNGSCFPWDGTPWRLQTAQNRDVSTEPLACLFAHHIHLFACSALLASLVCSTTLTHLLARALRYAHSFAHLFAHPVTPKLKKICYFDVT